jgi:signal transduction histidine kinase
LKGVVLISYLKERMRRILSLLVAYIFLVTVYSLFLEHYSVESALKRIHNTLLSTKALGNFVSDEQKDAVYKLQKEGLLSEDFFHPALLSSTYISRVSNDYYNKERKENNQTQIFFRQVSTNPLNTLNKANDDETKLISKFNNKSIAEYTDIIRKDGKNYLYHAIAFKKITQSCMRCHSTPEQAPKGLIDHYGSESGFGYILGEINAITSVTTSLEEDEAVARDYLSLLAFITLVLFIVLFILMERMLSKMKKIQRIEAYSVELKDYSFELEAKVTERTLELQNSLELIQETQAHLVETEKMASLGRLVAGVAHEINTPVGVSVTAASHLGQSADDFMKMYEDNKVTQTDFEHFIAVSKESTDIILKNLERAADLISSFKSISVDQSSGDIREINLREYFDAVLLSLHPKLKKTEHTVTVHCDKNIEVTIAAGALSQIITNLIDNALIHAFEEMNKGEIVLTADKADNILTIIYEDDGKGLTEEGRANFFEPFYTTKRSKGGSGLGTHVIFNLVTQSLKGTINLESQLDQGLKLTITIPLKKDQHV